jgi:hypothetical protein
MGKWKKAILCKEDNNRVVLDTILIESEQRSWWDLFGLFTGSDTPNYHKKLHKLDGKWKIDYTNTANVSKKWSNQYKKYIRQPPPDINGIPSTSWNYDKNMDFWNPPYNPPLLGEKYPHLEYDSIWVWNENKKCYVISKELCNKYELNFLYNPKAYYTIDGIKYEL